MRVLFIFILFFVSGYSYSQDFLKPDSDLFQNKLPDNTKIDPRNAYGVLRINMEVQQPIETDVVDDMKYLVGIVVDVETRDVEESNLV